MISKIEKIPFVGEIIIYILKFIRFNFIYKPVWFFRQFKNQENIFKIHYVSPLEIDKFSGGKFSFINKRVDIGKTKGGNWDLNTKDFKDSYTHKGFKERFLDNKPWNETVYYKKSIKRIRKGKRVNATNSIKEFQKRLKSLDKLYKDIKNNGYKENFDNKVNTYKHKSIFFNRAKKLESFLDNIIIDIDRKGDYLLVSGKHRLAIAKLLKLEKIPVIIRARHEKFMENNKKKEIKDLLHKEKISFCGYYDEKLPNFSIKKTNNISVFIRKNKDHLIENKKINKKYYKNLEEIRSQDVSVCFLDREAIKILIARYPTAPNYVLVRLKFRKEWLLGLLGLIRRVWYKKIKIGGVINFGKNQSWLILINRQKEYSKIDSGLSSDIGIKGFIKYLNKEKISYVILRFFEDLPDLHSAQRLNVLVSDEDKNKVDKFIEKNPGDVKISIRSPYSLYNNKVKISYYPPVLANKILENSVKGPIEASVPSKKYYLLSFVYHVLYHKGFDAGIPSKLFPDEVDKNPEKDYEKIIKRLIRELDLDIDTTLEDLDEFLKKEGWRPQIDTLEKLAKTNKWLWRVLLEEKSHKEIGLGALVFREEIFEYRELLNKIKSLIKENDFDIIKTKKIQKENQKEISSLLRGGDWKAGSRGINKHLPGLIIVVLDKKIVGLSNGGTDNNLNQNFRIRKLKKKIRKETKEIGNLVHSTDNTSQSWEYIEVCFQKNIIKDIKNKIEKIYKVDLQNSLWGMFKNKMILLPHYIKMKVSSFILEKVLR